MERASLCSGGLNKGVMSISVVSFRRVCFPKKRNYRLSHALELKFSLLPVGIVVTESQCHQTRCSLITSVDGCVIVADAACGATRPRYHGTDTLIATNLALPICFSVLGVETADVATVAISDAAMGGCDQHSRNAGFLNPRSTRSWVSQFRQPQSFSLLILILCILIF